MTLSRIVLFILLGLFGRASGDTLEIVTAEYFFDSDPGIGLGTPLTLTSGDDVSFDVTLPHPGLSPGRHTFFLRFQDSRGIWSRAKSVPLRVLPETGDIITAAEAFVDSDPGPGNGVAMYSEDGVFDENDESFLRNIALDTLSLGRHYVYARARSGNSWSFALRDSVFVGGEETFRIIAHHVDTLGSQVRLSWSNIGATEYRVHYDSVATGAFSGYYSVNHPDTSLTLTTTLAFGRRFYQVTAHWPETMSRESSTQPAR